MTRLNNNIREQILANALVKSGVVERESKLRTRRADLAENCRLHAIGGVEGEKKIRDVIEKRKVMFKELNLKYSLYGRMTSSLCEDHRVYVAFGGMSTLLYFNGENSKCGESVYKSPTVDQRVLFDAEHELSTTFTEIEKESEIVKSLREQVTVNTNAVLKSVTTIKKLIEVWPESKELIPSKVDTDISNLPSVDVNQLNTMIGIPTDK